MEGIMGRAFKRVFLFTTIISICLIQNTFGGSMSSLPYSKLKHPEQLFEIHLKMFNRQTLNELIPSIEAPPLTQKDSKFQPVKMGGGNLQDSEGLSGRARSGSSFDEITELAKQNLDYSKIKYIFGSIKYKNDFDYRVDTTVNFKIYSPNNPNLSVNNVVIRGIGTEKVYFLVYADSPVMNTSDTEAVLSYEIVEARAK
jgi:hypothetical protein